MSLNLPNLVNPLTPLAILAIVSPAGAAVFGLVLLGYKAHEAFQTWHQSSSSAEADKIFSLEQEIIVLKDDVKTLSQNVKNLTMAKLGRP